ncbi:MAG: ATP-dependent Clp protease adaptor ClpS [Nitrospiraceae bacterium]
MPSAVVIPVAIEDQTTGTGDDLEAQVTVYNCNCHTYEQVISLFCRTIPGMNRDRAFELAWRIDHEGNAIVYSGQRKTAEEIAKQLVSGGLRVAVQ